MRSTAPRHTHGHSRPSPAAPTPCPLPQRPTTPRRHRRSRRNPRRTHRVRNTPPLSLSLSLSSSFFLGAFSLLLLATASSPLPLHLPLGPTSWSYLLVLPLGPTSWSFPCTYLFLILASRLGSADGRQPLDKKIRCKIRKNENISRMIGISPPDDSLGKTARSNGQALVDRSRLLAALQAVGTGSRRRTEETDSTVLGVRRHAPSYMSGGVEISGYLRQERLGNGSRNGRFMRVDFT